MIIHVLPGDAQVETFKQTGIGGEIIVCREALVDGPIKASNLEEFWELRANFVAGAYDENTGSYFEKVVPEFEKLVGAAPGAEINLWFEHELFCQVNMWFCLYLLRDAEAVVYRVAPIAGDADRWKGFGRLGPVELKECFSKRTKFTTDDIALGSGLWDAYRNEGGEGLERLAATESDCFSYLGEVAKAATEKRTRPKQILQEIVDSGSTDFNDIFPAFADRAGVYGYGDLQVKAILNEL